MYQFLQFIFGIEVYMFRTVPLFHHLEFSTVHTAMVHPDPARKLSANLYDIYHCCVYCEKLLMMDRGTETFRVLFQK